MEEVGKWGRKALQHRAEQASAWDAAEREAAKAPVEHPREWTLADLAALSGKRKRA